MTNRKHVPVAIFVFLLAVLACPFTVTASASDTDWPMWRYDANRSAASPVELPARLHLQWKRELPAPRPAFPLDVRLCFDLSYEPVAIGKTMFVPSMVTDSVTVLDTETGALLWKCTPVPQAARDQKLLGHERLISRWPARGGRMEPGPFRQGRG